MVYLHDIRYHYPKLRTKVDGGSAQMEKTLWFKVESTGRAVTVKIEETANVLELMEAIMHQYPLVFAGQNETTL